MPSPLVSIIIPCFNQGQYLRESVSSALVQTYGNFEVIVVDDGSTDQVTLDLYPEIEKLEFRSQNSEFRKIQIVRLEKNSGVSAARNAGIAAAQGEYILPLDGDNKIEPEYIGKAVEVMERNPKMGIVYSDAELFGEEKGEWKLPDFNIGRELSMNCVDSCAMFRRKDWETIGGYDTSFRSGLEDWDFWLSIIGLGRELHKIPEILFSYRVRFDSLIRSMNHEEQIRLQAKVFRKHLKLYEQYADEFIHFIDAENTENMLQIQKILRELEESMNAKVAHEIKYENRLHEATRELLQQRELYEKQIKQESDQKDELEIQLQEKQKVLDEYVQTAIGLRSSLSFRFGMVMTWPFRRAYEFARPLIVIIRSLWKTLSRMQLGKIKTALILAWEGRWRELLDALRSDIMHAASANHSQEIQTTVPSLRSIVGWWSPAREPYDLSSPVDIVMPVYNSFLLLCRTIESVLRHTSGTFRLIIVNDASTDERIAPYLASLEHDHPDHIIVSTHSKNEGFIGAVRTGVGKVGKNNFVLLNSDTELPPHWNERLMRPIEENQNCIASVTPMTNAGTIASFPVFLNDNERFAGLPTATIDTYFKAVGQAPLIEVPTGVGFCMAINKKVWDEVGGFDAAFGRGYAEENDWCMRASQKGYRHVLAANLFVYHEHGGTFTPEEKRTLLARNQALLQRRHPTYAKLVQEYIKRDPHGPFRTMMSMLITAHESGAHPVCFIDHDLGGGTNMVRRKKIAEYLQRNIPVILLLYKFQERSLIVEITSDGNTSSYSLEKYEDLSLLFALVPVSEMYLEGLVSFPDIPDFVQWVVSIAEQYRITLTVAVHDYFAVCPSYTLLNQHNVYCDIPTDLTVCNRCMRESKGEWKAFGYNMPVLQWRQQWQRIFDRANMITCFSQSSAEIITRVFGAECTTKIKVIKHDVPKMRPVNLPQSRSGVCTIAVIGAINEAKGLEQIVALAKESVRQQAGLQIVIIGTTSRLLHAPNIRVHGAYTPDQLPDLLEHYDASAVMIPSIWPETFSLTTEEAFQSGLPVICFALGAQAERVSQYRRGLVLELNDSRTMLQVIHAFLAKEYDLSLSTDKGTLDESKRNHTGDKNDGDENAAQ